MVLQLLAHHDGELVERLVASLKPLFCLIFIQIVVLHWGDKVIPGEEEGRGEGEEGKEEGGGMGGGVEERREKRRGGGEGGRRRGRGSREGRRGRKRRERGEEEGRDMCKDIDALHGCSHTSF